VFRELRVFAGALGGIGPCAADDDLRVGALGRAAVIYARSGAVVEMGYVNDDFTKNLVTIRAEERLGLGIEVPSAILYGTFTL
jgi:hypothetical protein